MADVQSDLFGWSPPQSEQDKHLARVRSRIASAILAFLELRGVGATFHMQELTDYVADAAQTAPDSPGRILRALRREGLCDYKVENRRASLYRITAL